MMALPTSTFEGMFSMSPKIELTRTALVSYVIPPFVGQYLLGVLVQLEGTRFYRLALLPIVIWLACRACLVDMSGGEVKKTQLNGVLITQMCATVARSAVWALARERYRRLRPASDRRDGSNPDGVRAACWNTWDLLISPRGIEWNWPRGLVVPEPVIETDSRLVFVLSLAAGLAWNAFMFDACLQGVRALSPDTFGSIKGGTLFDGALPPAMELARAVLVAALGGASAYHGTYYAYHLLAIVGVVVFRQRPSQWPPLFNAPWLSTSLSELWGRRFHQLFRDMVLTLGARPFGCLFGRLGGLVGAFLISGLFHDVELRSSGRDFSTLVTVGFWVMNGVGVVLERVWERATGRPVGGMWGRAWTVGWLLLWGVPMVNEYAKVGRFGMLSLPGGVEPSLAITVVVRKFLARLSR